MRTRVIMALLLVMLVLAIPAFAQGSPAVSDSTALLSADTVEAIRTLNDDLTEKTGYSLAVEVRHFLGGAEPGAYARQLLDKRGNADKTILLLAVVGEERYAAASGTQVARALSAEAINSLLSVHFRGPFQARDYNQAVLAFSREAVRQIAMSEGVSLNALPAAARATASPAPSPTPRQEYESIKLPDLNSMLREPITPTEDPAPRRERADREERGLSIGSIIVIGLVLSSIFGRKKDRKGCGCGPLGWIFSVFGFSKLFGWRK